MVVGDLRWEEYVRQTRGQGDRQKGSERGRETRVLVCYVHVDQIRPHVVVIRVHNVDLVDEVTLLEPEHAARVGKVQRAVLVVEVPQRRELELPRADHDRRAVCARGGRGEQGAREGEHAAVGEDGVCAEDDFVHAGHEGVD